MKAEASRFMPWRWPAAWVHGSFFVALLVWAALECFGPLPSKAITASTYDQMQQRRIWASAPDPRILIIDIDERSLADMAGEFGRWPWPRDTLATLLDHAQKQGVKAVVFDILFSDPDRLHPGGDSALEAAVRGGAAGIFPVARLPAALDARSELRADRLPGLATAPSPATEAPRVAAILPFMQAMLDSRRLGIHTADLDSDGKLRRFAFNAALADGWSLRTIPAAVAGHLGVAVDAGARERLIVWRHQADVYPRVPFAVAWQCAEGRQRVDCPDLAGRILIVGATASSLHDIKTTPLAVQHKGVDILATLIDNALHQRSYDELPAALRWLLTAAALLLAWAVVRRGQADATKRALWGLPLLLLAIGYASLHSEVLYVDLSLPATAVLSFLSAVKLHDTGRRRLFGLRADACSGARAVVCGGPADHGERLERAVFDLAARWQLAVTGSNAASGECGAGHSIWVLWGMPDAPSSGLVVEAMCRAVPSTWCHGFAVGAEPRRDLFLAVASAMPAELTAAKDAAGGDLNVQT
jgi:adenylate cyclase